MLKDVLSKLTIDQSNPKLLTEYYFVCIASDNYKVVFSWNEIFNNETGKNVCIITELDEKKGASMDNGIALISPTDEATGRRYVQGLQKIIIERVIEFLHKPHRFYTSQVLKTCEVYSQASCNIN